MAATLKYGFQTLLPIRYEICKPTKGRRSFMFDERRIKAD